MKVFILTLLVLTSLCFALGGEEEKNADFVDLDADEGEVLPEVNDYVEEDEEGNYMDDLEDEDDSQEEEGNDEPKDPDGFKDDAFDPLEDPRKGKEKDNGTGKRPRPPPKVVLPQVELNPKPPKPSEEPGSGIEPEADADLKETLNDKLGLK